MLKIKVGDKVALSERKNSKKYLVIGISKPLPFIDGETELVLQRKSGLYHVSIKKIKSKHKR